MTEPEQDENEPVETGPARISPRLLEFLVCPVTRTTLEISKDRTELISRAARLAYPIRDGVALLTAETARELSDEELRK